MAEHVSKLVLDELAAGLPVAEDARNHASACAECEARLAELTAAREAAKASPTFERTFAALQSEPRVTRPRGSFPKLFALAPAVAVALVLFLLTRTRAPQEQESVRIKGAAAVRVLRAPEGTPVSAARVGDRVVIALAATEQPFALVFAVSEQGAIEQLWPSDSANSGQVDPGKEVRLEPGFTVTPGSVMLHAFFSQNPLTAQAVREHLEGELERAGRAQNAPVTPLVGAVRAATLLSVEGA